MASKSTVKVQTIIESQIPEFLRTDSPLFTEFLKQYYISQEFPTGNNDISVNIQNYKNIDTYSKQIFYTKSLPCRVTEEILSFSDEIAVTSTVGFPQRYGLLRINSEIITYTNKTDTKFLGCVRGFSGITNIGEASLNFEFSLSQPHPINSEVFNLNLVFYEKLFEKFKNQYVPDFYTREINIDYDLFLSNARNFYLSKGTDISYQLLFSILYNEKVDIIQPREYLISPSDERELITKNLLIEFINPFEGEIDTLIGKTVFQDISPEIIASAAIYNIEYRPLDDLNIFEVSLDVDSFIYEFEVTKKAYVEFTTSTSKSISVDSTYGYPNSGKCIVIPKNKTREIFEFTYNSKSLNQFYIDTLVDVEEGDIILDDKLGYIFDENSNKLWFRFINVIDNFDFNSTKLLEVGDKIKLTSFGNQKSNYFIKSLLTSYKTIHQLETPLRLRFTGFLEGTVKLYDFPKIYNNRRVNIINEVLGKSITLPPISNVNKKNKTFEIYSSNEVNVRNILNGATAVKLNPIYSENGVESLIQDSYLSLDDDNSYYIASNGTNTQSFNRFRFKLRSSNIIISSNKTDTLETLNYDLFESNTPPIRTLVNNHFFTGNKIKVYLESELSKPDADTREYKEYFIKKLPTNQISLYESQEAILLNKPPVLFEVNQIIGDGYLIEFDSENINNYQSQELFKNIKFPIGITTLSEKIDRKTQNKPIGILVNGVELVSPDILGEYLYYGEIKNVSIINSGKNYDVSTPPNLIVRDNISIGTSIGTGCKLHPHMKGVLVDAIVTTPGINYEIAPDISIVGGNIQNEISITPKLTQKQVTVEFSPNLISSNTISVVGSHFFEDGEEVIYLNRGNLQIGPNILDGNTYYVRIIKDNITREIDFSKLRLYKSKLGSLTGNPSELITYVVNSTGIYGIHELRAIKTKSIINEVSLNLIDTAILENKVIYIPALNVINRPNTNGISAVEDFIYAKNHNLKNKDCLMYSPTPGSSNPAGLSTTTKYLATVLDENRFKLSSAGNLDIPNDTNYKNQIYVNFTNNVGLGTHKFYTPKIEIKIKSSSNLKSPFVPLEIEPIVLGEISNIFIENPGSNYGSDKIVNYHRRPEVIISDRIQPDDPISNPTIDAVLVPIIQNGKIISIQILSPGSNYQNNIDIVVNGEGKYAKLYPIINNGKIIDVKILSSGVGYNPTTSRIDIIPRGKDGNILANVNSWTIDVYRKYSASILNTFRQSRGAFTLLSKYIPGSVQTVNFTSPKDLVNSVQDLDESGSNYLIVGWSYDGCPIVYPKQITPPGISLETKYSLVASSLNSLSRQKKRPKNTIDEWPNGSFIEDYTPSNTTTQLDEHNGLYITGDPVIPDGTYAYVITYNTANGNSRYPYAIGPEFKFNPIEYNFDYSNSQNEEVKKLNLTKNTEDLFLSSDKTTYPPLGKLTSEYRQEFRVSKTLDSGIDDSIILNPGNGYKVGDKITFKTDEPYSILPLVEVSQIRGKSITQSSISTVTNEIQFELRGRNIVGIATTPHNFKDNSYLDISTINSGISSNYTKLNGVYNIKVSPEIKTVLLDNILSTGSYSRFRISDVDKFGIDDFIKIDNETFKVIEIDFKKSSVKCSRISTKDSHSSGSVVTKLENKFEFIFNDNLKYTQDSNIKYFNPSQVVGVGTTGTIFNETENSQIVVPPNKIYIPNHGFKTNQRVVYNLDIIDSGDNFISISNTATSAEYEINGSSVLYAQNFGPNFVGLKTGRNYSPVFFRTNDLSLGQAHYIKNYTDNIVGVATNQKLRIETSNTNQLETNDLVGFSYPTNLKNNNLYQIDKISANIFEVNIPSYDIIDTLSKVSISSLEYYTTSFTENGPIYKTNIKKSGNFFKRIPSTQEIITENGKLAEIVATSTKIGKIDLIERTKDGYDYPSDLTLTPKLSTISICYLENSYRIDEISVIYGGSGYVSPPNLVVKGPNFVVGSTNYALTPILNGGTIDSVSVIDFPSNLRSTEVELVAINNSNGYEIRIIDKLPDTTKLKIFLNLSSSAIFPNDITVGDSIFIENCNVDTGSGKNYNSSDYNYFLYEINSIDLLNNAIEVTIPVKIVAINTEFGNYSTLGGFGTFTLKSKLPEFSIKYEKNDYAINEEIYSYDKLNPNIVAFKGTVIGWNPNINQLRISNEDGELFKDYSIKSQLSLLTNTVRYFETFDVFCSLNETRDKINYLNTNISDLSNQYKRLQDGNYYQKFSYSLLSKVPYNVWKEPIRSIVHPSGYKEFSDLSIISSPEQSLRVTTISKEDPIRLTVKIDNFVAFKTIKNYTIGYDISNRSVTSPDFSERINFGTGANTWPVAYIGNIPINNIIVSSFTENITNEVITLRDISNEFEGTDEVINLTTKNITFNSQEPTLLGISTSGLLLGDLIGISTYLSSTEYTRILNILPGDKVEILTPHKNYSGSVTRSISIFRPLNQNNLVGISSFKLNNTSAQDILKILVPSNATNISIGNTSTIYRQHIFKKGQKIKYYNIGGTPIEIQSTSNVIGGISTSILPNELYVHSSPNNREFSLSGLIDSSKIIFTSRGSGTHIFTFDDPNKYALIQIDNIVQSPLTYRGIDLILGNSINQTQTTIQVPVGINSLRYNDTLQIGNEYLAIVSLTTGIQNQIIVQRGSYGSVPTSHTQNAAIKVYSGNYLIVEDIIYFGSIPKSIQNINGSLTKSRFDGRIFTRQFDSKTRNIILDDISSQFNGETSFKLLENGNSVVGIFTNKDNLENQTNINNNPIILINNTIQSPENSFTVDNVLENTINFVGGSPTSGKIYSYSYTKGSGYTPLVAASSTVTLSPTGGVLSLTLNGSGSGYREPPNIEIRSPSGSGAAITANIGVGGTITGFNIVSAGVGYNTEGFTYVDIDSPLPYVNMDLEYSSPSSGIGTSAKVSVKVNNDGEIDSISFINNGINYKKGDNLKVSGLVASTSGFTTSILTVTEISNDDFRGIYYGQFIKCRDISNLFNSQKRIFDLFTVVSGVERQLFFASSGSANVDNKFIVLINGIVQEPTVSYKYSSGQIYFEEAPTSGSSCVVLYYTGSSLDLISVNANTEIKVGDGVKLNDSPFSIIDSEQKSRVVTKISSPISVDTFIYQDYGVNYLVPKPIDLIRQDSDLIINGEIVYKNRTSQNCNIIPVANVIKSISKTDDIIYLDSAYPLFKELDKTEIAQSGRSIRIVENTSYSPVISTVTISGVSSSISAIAISSTENIYTSPPEVSISNPTIAYIDPSTGISTFIRATALAELSPIGKLSAIQVVNGGYGYENGKVNILVARPEIKYEDISSVDVIGDYGKIVGIITYPPGTPGIGTNTPKLSFKLQSDSTQLNSYNIQSSQLQVGDYFVIRNSNVICGHALTGITTEFGGMANFPTSKVGTAVSFLDGVYRVEDIERPAGNIGIVTVSCNFAPNVTGGIDISVSLLNSNYYGDYSWAKIINFESRDIDKSYDFEVNVDNGLVGIQQSVDVYRNQPIPALSNRNQTII
jgi:hypothetical protein